MRPDSLRQMPSPAYSDFLVRVAEARYLMRRALEAPTPEVAGTFAKSSIVLAVAALERYVNDLYKHLCARVAVEEWAKLTEAQQRFMAYQIGKRLVPHVRRVAIEKSVELKYRERLRRVVDMGSEAFQKPVSWSGNFVPYGMFMDGAPEPERIAKTLEQLSDSQEGLFKHLETRGRDRSAICVALTGMIDTRHRVAHAISGPSPGPEDVRRWIVLASVLVREIEVYFSFRPGATS